MVDEEKLIKTYSNGMYELRSHIEAVPLNQDIVDHESNHKSLREFSLLMFWFSVVGIISTLFIFYTDPQAISRWVGLPKMPMALLLPVYDLGLILMISVCIWSCIWIIRYIPATISPQVQQYEISLRVYKRNNHQGVFEEKSGFGTQFTFDSTNEESGKQKIKVAVDQIDHIVQSINEVQERQDKMRRTHDNLVAYASLWEKTTYNRFVDIDISMDCD